MELPRIYADFNGLQQSPRTEGFIAIHLHRHGSLVDLSWLGLCLSEGLELNVYSDSDEKEDLEAIGFVYFDAVSKQWFIEFQESDIRYELRPPELVRPKFPCWSCKADLTKHVSTQGLDYGHTCSNCGLEIHTPLRPPAGNIADA